MAKDLQYMTKQRADEYMFGSVVQFSIWYKALASEKKEEQARTTDDSSDGSSKNEKGESVGLRPSFEIEKSALLYTRAVGNY